MANNVSPHSLFMSLCSCNTTMVLPQKSPVKTFLWLMSTFLLLIPFKLFHCQAILKLFPMGFTIAREESDAKAEAMLTGVPCG